MVARQGTPGPDGHGGVLAIINGLAGGGAGDEKSRGDITTAIMGEFPHAEVVFAGEGDDVGAVARGAVEDGVTTVIAGGGDGTINAVASALSGTAAVLGLLPLGTLNHFARDLGIPNQLGQALKVLAARCVALVDTAEVNGRLFLNNANLGLYPTTVALREQIRERGIGKWPAQLWAMLKALVRFRKFTVRVTSDNEKLVRETPVIFVGNNKYEMQGLRLGMRDQIDRGELCLYIPHHRNPLRLVWTTLRAMMGKEPKPEEFDALFSDALTIESRHAHLTVALDGELMRMATPLRYSVRPRTLRVLVPPGE